ncbi:hypothetical protein LCGC14_0483730 [marine sediment metagenome]|uniref:HNH nuclease domain-containing protein n=1 Tax=marine sediment metagenome TaxID=412755 RepID=A0A0F9SRU5_9ZZZZ
MTIRRKHLIKKLQPFLETTTIPKGIIHDGKELHFHRPCKLFRGATDGEYGVIRVPKGFMGVKDGVVRAHRLALYLKTPFPVKMQVDHLCRNTLCCEETHLVIIGPKTHGRLSKEDQIDGN